MSGEPLQVFLNRERAGFLERISSGKVRFGHDESLADNQVVSLAWPDKSDIESEGLHAVFDQSFPEGYLKERLVEGLRSATGRVPDDLTLLRAMGRSMIGRIRVVESNEALDAPLPSFDYQREVMEGRASRMEILADLVAKFAQNAGVAGVQPKIQIADAERFTLQGPTHILKTFDPRTHPGLAANEMLCMEIAKEAGMETAKVELSYDGAWLAIERFDLMADGGYMGFEDFCSLAQIRTGWKYHGSYENIAAILMDYSDNFMADGEALFDRVSLSCILRDGDAHRKNFGVLYSDSENAALSPAYDIVCTKAYIEDDEMALEMNGTKEWPDREGLIEFARRCCLMNRAKAMDSLDRICSAVDKVIRSRMAEDLPGTAPKTIERMRLLWEASLKACGFSHGHRPRPDRP